MDQDEGDWKKAAETVPELRWLKALVTGLAVVMGLGIIAIVVLVWMRLSQPMLPDLPATISLPEGAEAEAVTFARDFIVVVTEAGEVLLYDRAGALKDQLQP